jgi:hypothetical protein
MFTNNIKKNVVKSYIWSIALNDAESCKLRKVEQKCVESFEIWCWRRKEGIGPILREMKYYIESRRKGISYIQ